MEGEGEGEGEEGRRRARLDRRVWASVRHSTHRYGIGSGRGGLRAWPALKPPQAGAAPNCGAGWPCLATQCMPPAAPHTLRCSSPSLDAHMPSQ